jgi:hypothetical protein
MKLLELARARAKKDAAGQNRLSALSGIIQEEPAEAAPKDPGTPMRIRKPLYRQSSMDFMSSAKIGNKATEGLSR